MVLGLQTQWPDEHAGTAKFNPIHSTGNEVMFT